MKTQRFTCFLNYLAERKCGLQIGAIMIFDKGGVNMGMILWRVYRNIESWGNYLVSPPPFGNIFAFLFSLSSSFLVL